MGFFDELGDIADATRVSIRIRWRVLGTVFGALAPHWKEVEEVIDLPPGYPELYENGHIASGLDSVSGPSLFEMAGPIPKRRSRSRDAGTAVRSRGSPGKIKAVVNAYLTIQRAANRSPNMDRCCDCVQKLFPDAGRDRVRDFYRNLAGNTSRGRPKKKIADENRG
jgi:hypothetical protein